LYPAPPVLGGGASGSGVGPASMMSKSRSLGGTLGSSAVGSAVSIGYVGEDDGKDADSKRLVSLLVHLRLIFLNIVSSLLLLWGFVLSNFQFLLPLHYCPSQILSEAGGFLLHFNS